MKIQGLGRRLIGKLRTWKLRLYMALGLYPKYAIRQIIEDNPDMDSLTGNGLHIFVAVATNEHTADSIRFGWLRRALNEGDRIALIKMDYDAIFSRIAPVVMPTFYRGLPHVSNDNRSAIIEYSKGSYAKERERYRSVCKQVFEAFHKRWRVDAVVNSGVEQYWAREAIVAARELKIPWIVADIGFNPTLVIDRKTLGGLFRRYYPFEVDLLLIHSDYHSEFFQACGVPADKIKVTGEIKFDYWSHPEVWAQRHQIHPALRNDRTLILYFAFQPQAYLGNFRFPGESRDWAPLRKEHERVLEDIAIRYSQQVQIVYKSGHQPDLAPRFYEMVRRKGLSNLIFVDGKHLAQPLIVNADIIVGLQSSAMIEASFSTKAVVYAGWGELHDDIADSLLPFHKTNAILHAKSADHLREVMTQYLDSVIPLEADAEVLKARAKFREHYFYKPDGNSSRRVLNEIRQFLLSRNLSGDLVGSPSGSDS